MDPAVVERARGGDRDAFANLVAQVSDALYAVAFRILRETGAAEDALQNALIATWQQLPHLRDADRFEAWAHRILVHACYAEFGRRRQFAANVRVIEMNRAGASDGSRVLADRDELDRAFRKIPVDQRAVFVLHHYIGLPLVEVAETLGIPAAPRGPVSTTQLNPCARSWRTARCAPSRRDDPHE